MIYRSTKGSALTISDIEANFLEVLRGVRSIGRAVESFRAYFEGDSQRPLSDFLSAPYVYCDRDGGQDVAGEQGVGAFVTARKATPLLSAEFDSNVKVCVSLLRALDREVRRVVGSMDAYFFEGDEPGTEALASFVYATGPADGRIWSIVDRWRVWGRLREETGSDNLKALCSSGPLLKGLDAIVYRGARHGDADGDSGTVVSEALTHAQADTIFSTLSDNIGRLGVIRDAMLFYATYMYPAADRMASRLRPGGDFSSVSEARLWLMYRCDSHPAISGDYRLCGFFPKEAGRPSVTLKAVPVMRKTDSQRELPYPGNGPDDSVARLSGPALSLSYGGRSGTFTFTLSPQLAKGRAVPGDAPASASLFVLMEYGKNADGTAFSMSSHLKKVLAYGDEGVWDTTVDAMGFVTRLEPAQGWDEHTSPENAAISQWNATSQWMPFRILMDPRYGVRTSADRYVKTLLFYDTTIPSAANPDRVSAGKYTISGSGAACDIVNTDMDFFGARVTMPPSMKASEVSDYAQGRWSYANDSGLYISAKPSYLEPDGATRTFPVMVGGSLYQLLGGVGAGYLSATPGYRYVSSPSTNPLHRFTLYGASASEHFPAKGVPASQPTLDQDFLLTVGGHVRRLSVTDTPYPLTVSVRKSGSSYAVSYASSSATFKKVTMSATGWRTATGGRLALTMVYKSLTVDGRFKVSIGSSLHLMLTTRISPAMGALQSVAGQSVYYKADASDGFTEQFYLESESDTTVPASQTFHDIDGVDITEEVKAWLASSTGDVKLVYDYEMTVSDPSVPGFGEHVVLRDSFTLSLAYSYSDESTPSVTSVSIPFTLSASDATRYSGVSVDGVNTSIDYKGNDMTHPVLSKYRIVFSTDDTRNPAVNRVTVSTDLWTYYTTPYVLSLSLPRPYVTRVVYYSLSIGSSKVSGTYTMEPVYSLALTDMWAKLGKVNGSYYPVEVKASFSTGGDSASLYTFRLSDGTDTQEIRGADLPSEVQGGGAFIFPDHASCRIAHDNIRDVSKTFTLTLLRGTEVVSSMSRSVTAPAVNNISLSFYDYTQASPAHRAFLWWDPARTRFNMSLPLSVSLDRGDGQQFPASEYSLVVEVSSTQYGNYAPDYKSYTLPCPSGPVTVQTHEQGAAISFDRKPYNQSRNGTVSARLVHKATGKTMVSASRAISSDIFNSVGKENGELLQLSPGGADTLTFMENAKDVWVQGGSARVYYENSNYSQWWLVFGEYRNVTVPAESAFHTLSRGYVEQPLTGSPTSVTPSPSSLSATFKADGSLALRSEVHAVHRMAPGVLIAPFGSSFSNPLSFSKTVTRGLTLGQVLAKASIAVKSVRDDSTGYSQIFTHTFMLVGLSDAEKALVKNGGLLLHYENGYNDYAYLIEDVGGGDVGSSGVTSRFTDTDAYYETVYYDNQVQLGYRDQSGNLVKVGNMIAVY